MTTERAKEIVESAKCDEDTTVFMRAMVQLIDEQEARIALLETRLRAVSGHMLMGGR